MRTLLLALLVPWLAAASSLDLSDIDAQFQQRVKSAAKGFQGAYAVVRGGKLAAAGGSGKANRDTGEMNTHETSFRLASVTKPLTAAAVMQLVEANLLDLEKPMSAYLSGFGDKGDRILVKHLLSHGSGLRDYVGSVGAVSGPEELMEVIRQGTLQFSPGTQYQYSNSNFAVLGYLVEKITGKPYETVIEDKVFRAAGMTKAGYDFPKIPGSGFAAPSGGNPHGGWEPTKKAYAAGALYASALDLARFGHALLQGRLVTSATLAKMTTKQNGSYGYGLKIYDKAYAGHDGVITGFTSQLYLNVRAGHVIAVVSNGRSSAPGLAAKLRSFLGP